MGNLHSVQQAFKRLNQEIKIIREPADIKICQALILPGVGAFDPAMEQLKKTNLIPHLHEWVKQEKPLLGICLGLQLLFESSEEGKSKGLGLLKGQIKLLPANQGERIPHMGWAQLNPKKNCPLLDQSDQESWMYFVHSYAAIPNQISDLAATAKFGGTEVTAIIWKKKLGACQFHPEKSSKSGEKMLSRWLTWLNTENENQK